MIDSLCEFSRELVTSCRNLPKPRKKPIGRQETSTLTRIRDLSENVIIIKDELKKTREASKMSKNAELPRTETKPKRGDKVGESTLAEQIKLRIEAKRAKSSVSLYKILQVLP